MRTIILAIIVIFGFFFFPPEEAKAQLINLKTAPVATGDQFMVQPPVNAGMGGLYIAFDDTLGDALVNPAKTGRLNGVKVYMSPTFYRITNGNGTAKTLSVGGLTSANRWFGGLGVAIQDMDRPHAGSNRLKDQSTNNNYLWLQGGRLLNEETSLGGRLFWAGLGASEGVDMLYPRSDRINQDGYMLDIRLGLDGKMDSRGRYEILALFARTDMTHEVIYQNPCIIQPGLCSPSALTVPNPPSSVEKNMDKTNTWGLHLGYDRPVGESSWRWGSVLTLNIKTHPKIPNYELMNIPRDPGNTWALNAGMGASNTSENNVTFGADFIIEPVWSNTWVEAQEDIWDEEETELLVEKGDKTIENEFAFMNSLVKTGLGWRGKHVLLESGILAKTYRYELKQKDYVEDTFRDQEENWTEWTFSLSAGMIFESVELKYTGLLTTGTGRPGTASSWGNAEFAMGFASTGGDFIFAPDGELALENARVFTHQVTVTIPL